MVDTVIISTLIAVVVSAVGSYVSYFFSTRKAEQDARRKYEYDARQRLYQEYEPLIFQLHELCENAYNRIANLAENLRDGRGLTTFDLALEDHFENEYLFAKALYHVFRRDHWFADPSSERYSKIDHYPHSKNLFAKALFQLFRRDPSSERYSKIDYYPHDYPEKYRDQAIHLGEIDKMSEALLKREPPDPVRVMSFGEFSDHYFSDKDKDTYFLEKKQCQPFCEISCLFLNFHPATSPVLWRILTAHAYICRMISNISKEKDLETILKKDSILMPTEDYKEFYWYNQELDKIEGNLYLDQIGNVKEKMCEITQENFKIAEKYLKDSLIGRYGKY